MDFLKQNSPPSDLNSPIVLYAFRGWADASESATHALRHLVRQLGAEQFAEIDPEEFYNFTRNRPQVRQNSDGERYIQWPRNRFFYAKNDNGKSDLIIFLGTEPNFRWRTFTQGMVDYFKELHVSEVVHVGALLDAVPHTRKVKVTGRSSSPEIAAKVPGMQLRRSKYTGPTGITSVLMEEVRVADIPSMSLWGHSPHYLQVSPNPKVSIELLKKIEQLVGINLDYAHLQSQSQNFDKRVKLALQDEPELLEYVHRLEGQWDIANLDDISTGNVQVNDSIDMPEPEQAVKGIEEFLRQQLNSGPELQND